ncbi:hypothetical protein D3C81_2221840 [compost metagenome]
MSSLARKYFLWAVGGIVLAIALLGLATAGWFLEMPGKGLFAFVAFVVMFPLVGVIRFNWQGWKISSTNKLSS